MRSRKKRLVLAALAALGLAASLGAWRWSRADAAFGLTRLALEYELMMSHAELEKQAESGSSAVYYFTSYFLNGLLSAYEGTGDERLLRRAFALMDEMERRARVFTENGKEFRVWGPFWVAGDSPVPRPNLHFTFQAAVPFSRAVAIVRGDRALARRHKERAYRYAAFVEGSVMDYFYERQLQRVVPWIDRDHFPLWNDNASNLALNAAYLCRAGLARHCPLAVEIGTEFKGRLRFYKRGWIWENQTIPIGSDTDNTPGSVGNQAGVPDISHTNREAFLMTALEEMGLLFSREDLDRMAATLTETIWNGSLEEPSFSNYLNGDDRAYRVYKRPGLNGSVYHGWALMGAYSPKAQRVMLATLEAIYRGKRNGALERNSTSFGARLALAGHVLRNFSGPRRAPPPAADVPYYGRERQRPGPPLESRRPDPA